MAIRSKEIKGIAYERVETLFKEASNSFRKYPNRSHKYVQSALKIAAKAGIRIPKKYRSNYCRKCKVYLSSGSNSKIRTKNNMVLIHCNACKGIRKLVLKKSE